MFSFSLPLLSLISLFFLISLSFPSVTSRRTPHFDDSDPCFQFRLKSNSTIVDIARGVPELSTLYSVLTQPEYSGIASVLSHTQNFLITAFAPTNEAFIVANLNLSDVVSVSNVLLYHVSSNYYYSGLPAPLTFINELLIAPPQVNLNGEGQYLGVYKTSANDVTLGGASVYPIQSRPRVIIPDVCAFNGIVHVVDQVLGIPSTPNDVLLSNGYYIFFNEIVGGGFLSALTKNPSYTLFAPSDSGFQIAFNGWLAGGKSDQKLINRVLSYLVVPGLYSSNDLIDGQTLTSFLGNTITVNIDAKSGAVILNRDTKYSAVITTPNLISSNGFIHGIDNVLYATENKAEILLK